MGFHALGEVKPASTTVALRITNNQTDPAKQYPAQAVQLQALEGNTGGVYVVDRQTPTLTSHCLAYIPPPPFTWAGGNPTGPSPLNAADVWVVPAVSGEGVRVTVVR